MALKIKLPTEFGPQDTYLRLNSVRVSNHGAKARALFRAFASEEAFKSGKGKFVHEFELEFDADVSKPIWEQAYVAMKNYDPVAQLKYKFTVDYDKDEPKTNEDKNDLEQAETLLKSIKECKDC